MSMFKKTLLASLIVAGSLAAAPAFASGYIYQVYSAGAWSSTGTGTISGPTTATVAGVPVPCTANFGLTLTSGAAKVTSASFSGSSACTGITTNAGTSPWPIAAPIPISGSTSVTVNISGITVGFAQPAATCTNGTATGTLTNANPNPPTGTTPVVNNFSFTASFPSPTACTNVRSTNNPAMVSDKPIRALFVP